MQKQKQRHQEAKKTPLGIADRIGKEAKLKILKANLKNAEDDTAELWQRDGSPEKVKERDDLRAQVAQVERELLA